MSILKRISVLTLSIAMIASYSASGTRHMEKKHPIEIKISTDEEYWKYMSSSASKDITFTLMDYVGTWSDSGRRNMDFIFREDLSLELDWRKGTCKILEQTNNTLLLHCEGYWGRGTNSGPQYVRLHLFYVSKDRTSARLYMDITFNQDLDCARRGLADSKNNCFIIPSTKQTVASQNFKMYYLNIN